MINFKIGDGILTKDILGNKVLRERDLPNGVKVENDMVKCVKIERIYRFSLCLNVRFASGRQYQCSAATATLATSAK